MRPIIFSWGPIHLYSFGLMVALGTLAAIYVMRRRAKSDGFPSPSEVYDLVFVTLVAGFLGARIFYVIENLGWYFKRPWEILAIWQGGLVYYGGLLAAIATLFIWSRMQGRSFRAILDFVIVPVVLTHAFGRIGCFLNGCCYGRVTHAPWGVLIPPLSEPVHPTQLYEMTYLVILFVFLTVKYKYRRFEGEIIALYLIFYGIGRFVIENFRADNPTWWILTYNQWMSLGFILLGYFLFAMRKNKRSS